METPPRVYIHLGFRAVLGPRLLSLDAPRRVRQAARSTPAYESIPGWAEVEPGGSFIAETPRTSPPPAVDGGRHEWLLRKSVSSLQIQYKPRTGRFSCLTAVRRQVQPGEQALLPAPEEVSEQRLKLPYLLQCRHCHSEKGPGGDGRWGGKQGDLQARRVPSSATLGGVSACPRPGTWLQRTRCCCGAQFNGSGAGG